MNVVYVNIMGGLGNQLFQVAAAFAYAKHTNRRLQIIYNPDNGNRPLYWDNVLYRFQLCLVSHLPANMEQWYEPQPTQYQEIDRMPGKNVYLNGYLQSSRYYMNDEIKQEIKDFFRPHPRLRADLSATYSNLIRDADRVIVMHARRTDYVALKEFHGPLESSYYKEAVQRMIKRIENPIFILCGDDQSYWNEIREDIPEVFEHEHHLLRESDIRTFALLQNFKNFIMSNSTFIWWCVWMAKAQHVMVPSVWFGPRGPSNYEDIYEPSWERI